MICVKIIKKEEVAEVNPIQTEKSTDKIKSEGFFYRRNTI